MKRKAEAHLTLSTLFHDVGVLPTIVTDNAPELVKGEFKKEAIHARAVMHPIEVYTHNQSIAESAIRELRRMYKRAMRKPMRLMSYGIIVLSLLQTCFLKQR
jgi:hypothetical protein